MFEPLVNAWKIADLRKKILYTIMMLIVFRIGSHIPIPGINPETLANLVGNFDALNLLDTIAGGAFSNATIFAMSITPYINSSIIMNLLTVVIPALERKQREGEEGRKFIAQLTRYLTVVLAFIQASGLYFALRSPSAPEGGRVFEYLIIVLSLTAGTSFLMWLGEHITENGIGNGISLLIFAGIVSRGPQMVQAFIAYMQNGQLNIYTLILLLIVIVLVVAAVVAMNNAERRIPVQYAKRVVGRKMYGGQSTHIPIKVLMAGVIPIIFAMSIMTFPLTIMQLFGYNPTTGVMGWITKWILSTTSPGYIILYFLLILFFTFFYTKIQFNSVEMANNMQRNGGFVPGIRPGKPTAQYIDKVLSRVTMAGALFIGLIAVFPLILGSVFKINIAIGGTSLLIVVGVVLETVKQVESQMLVRHYKGFLE